MIRKLSAWLAEERHFLAAALGAAFLLRLAFVLKTGAGGLSPDAYDWVNTGWSLASGQGFGASWRPPGYAFYLAGVFTVFGKSVLAAKFMNAVLGTATVLFVYLVAKEMLGERTARLTAALLSYYPYLIAYTGDLLSETFLTFMLAASILALVRAAAAPSLKRLGAAGVLMGLTALTKSVVLPFFLLACCWLWWRTGRLRAPLLAGVFTILAIAPWTLRNYLFFPGSYVMPVNTPWYSLYGAACDEAILNETVGDVTKGPGVKAVDQFLPADWNAVSAMPLPERDKYCREKALGWMRANPGKMATLLRLRLLHFWRLYPMIAYAREKAAAIATSGLYLPLAAAGFLLSLRSFAATSLLLTLFVSYTLVHLFFVVTLRYRVPIDPYVIILASYAVLRLYDGLAARLKAGEARHDA